MVKHTPTIRPLALKGLGLPRQYVLIKQKKGTEDTGRNEISSKVIRM